jgi:hypothetical protein
MLDGLKTALDATEYDFRFAAWSKAPEGDYGVYFADGQNALSSDEDSASEAMLEGWVDYFTRDASETPKSTIEAALRGLGIWWTLESIQFEDDTGYIHYEWRWRDTNGKVRVSGT